MSGFQLSDYDVAVFDLDGTVWLSGDPIDGAAEFLDRCRSEGLTVVFATNITLSSVDEVRANLLACGLARDGERVVTAGVALAATVAAAGITEVVALTSPPLADALSERGIRVIHVDDVDRTDWATPRAGAALVLTGWPDATLRQIETIGQLAAFGHPIYISSLDPGFPGRHGYEPGAGMMVAAARALHRFEPIVCGKPSIGCARTVLEGLAADARVVMFGDSQRADVGLAHLMGADSVLLVGSPAKAVADDLPAPTFVAESVVHHPEPYRVPAAGGAEVDADHCQVYGQVDGFRPLELDVYRPVGATDPLPVVVYIHGGGWRVSSRHSGPRETRAWRRDMFSRWCDAGFAVVAVEYRYSAEAIHPAPIDDVCVALDWLRDQAATYQLDMSRVVLWGQSAGGHIAASVGLRPDAGPIDAVMCWYPITDFCDLDGHDDWQFAEHYLGHPIASDLAHSRAASATTLVHPGAPPFLLVHGVDDVMAPVSQSVVLADRLRAVGVPVTLELIEGADHFFAGRDDVELIFERTVQYARDVVN